MAADSYLPITYKVNLLDKVFRIASMVWIIVALALLIINTILYIMARYEVSDANHLSDNIYASDRVLSPVTYGIFRPRIIIPKEYKADDLQYILAHETAHIYRKDNLCRILALMSTLVHWFNPLIWLFLKKFLEVTELACDESVLAACGEDEKKAYATALVNSTESRSVFASAFGGARIKVRISYILSYKRLSILSIICFTLLAMTIAYVLLTNAAY
jgi:beta-lactamase regulating signal transducer with metallopeptidase domain